MAWTRRGRTLTSVTVLAVSLVMSLLCAAGSTASIAQPRVVTAVPADFTPDVVDDAWVANARVNEIVQVGGMIYAGGLFRTVRKPGATFVRSNVLAFSATTGAMSSFAPKVDGEVWALVPSADGKALYIAGSFSTIDGLARRGLARYDLASKQVDARFDARLDGDVTDAQMVGSRLFASGKFSRRLAALNPGTGAVDGYLNVSITGTTASNAGPTNVYRFAVNPAGTRLVMIGNFTAVGGHKRRQAAMLTLGASGAGVSGWTSRRFDVQCKSLMPTYTRDVDFSPDGSYFVIVTTGGGFPNDSSRLCDSASKWATVDSASLPVWVNYTGGDTLHSVAVTGVAVYVGGHQRWLDNPGGNNTAGPGAVSRPGIGAIHPDTGKALPWNPTKTRGVGTKKLYATSTGLWIGSDGRLVAGKVRDSIAYFSL